MIKNILIGAVIWVCLTSFQQPKPKSLTGKWKLFCYVDENNKQTIFPNSRKGDFKDIDVLYQFNDDCENGEIQGKEFCNVIDGYYELEYPNKVKSISYCGTEKFCPEIPEVKNYSFLKANTYEVSNDILTINYIDNTGIMTFIKVK